MICKAPSSKNPLCSWRIEEAKRLLLETNETVNKISDITGFYSPNVFYVRLKSLKTQLRDSSEKIVKRYNQKFYVNYCCLLLLFKFLYFRISKKNLLILRIKENKRQVNTHDRDKRKRHI